ncbi:unnamed protein product [Penicillium egyptiacum]|uniref:aldehyde dehydrogenase (NAD(+)) n=1 Tax=Penicillium egyptiacum TaxID=1303716 RepID=A0A9W4KN51_9EURO|nr:unnamed protein product [Penicillium egyptiacum]
MVSSARLNFSVCLHKSKILLYSIRLPSFLKIQSYAIKTPLLVTNRLSQIFHNVINSELTSTAQTRHAINPANKQPNPPVPLSAENELNSAVNAAQRAFRLWAQFPIEQRRVALFAWADALDSEKDGFTNLLTQEQGKPLSQALVEVNTAVTWIKGLATLDLPEITLEDSKKCKIIQRFVPLGVACAIVPWNFPILLAVGKITSALITGNSIIVKPSPFTPYSALKLAELAIPFFPAGLFQALSGDETLGPLMTAHSGIQKISFTGSTATGKKVAASCAKFLKHYTLELGGNDPAIICEDVDIEDVVQKVGILSFLCSGQVCMMIKRIYVHESIYNTFRDKLVAFVETLVLGEGTKPDVFVGPVQNEMQFNKAKGLFASIQSEGLIPALGGTIEDSAGYFIDPTIIDNPPENSRVVTEEPFAPIVPLMKWSDENDVIFNANNGPMGLGSSVWSKDLERAHRIGRQMRSGSVWINSHFDVAPHVPFGGHKESGIGVELGLEGLKGFCNSQTLWFNK